MSRRYTSCSEAFCSCSDWTLISDPHMSTASTQRLCTCKKSFRDGRTTRQRCDIQQTIKSTMLSGCFQIQQRANLLHWKGRLEVCSKKMEIEKRHVKPYHPRIKPIARKSMRKHDARKAFCSSQVTSTSSKCSRPSLLWNGLGLIRRGDVVQAHGNLDTSSMCIEYLPILSRGQQC